MARTGPGVTAAPAPIIVTAGMHAEDFAWLDGLRRRHFPPDRNIVPAHLTLFHHLPPSVAVELKDRLAALCRDDPPECAITGLKSFGRGVAFAVRSAGLTAMRDSLADHFDGLLTLQDRAGWRPHVTIQNKVAPEEARTLLQQLSRDFTPRPLRITGLASWWYRGGPWEPLSSHAFNRSGRSRRS